MSVAVADAMTAAGIWDLTAIDTIIIDVQNIQARSRLAGVIIEVENDFDRYSSARLVGIGRINEMPFHSYWQIAQLAQNLGMRTFLSDTVGRIKGMCYNEDKKPYGVEIADINLIYRETPDDDMVLRNFDMAG